MIQNFKMLIVSLSFGLMGLLPVMAVSGGVAFAQQIQGNLCQGASLDVTKTATDEASCATAGADRNSIQRTLSRIINIVSLLVGVVAVIMIIFGGFKYITSGGTSEKVTSAKNTILYGLIGLVIVALAQVIVKFVLRETSVAGA